MVGIELLLGALVGLALSLTFIPVILRSNWLTGFAQSTMETDHRHLIPTSRLGGMVFAGTLLSVSLMFNFWEPDIFQNDEGRLVICASLAIFGLGLWDDLWSLSARSKFFGQMLVAGLTVIYGVSINHFQVPFTNHIIQLGVWAWPITMLWLVAATNLFNLIDRVDGLAGGISLPLIILLLYVSLKTGFVPLITAAMLGALLGFMRFNSPPARIYLGAGGTYLIGFLIGCLTIISSQKSTLAAALTIPLFFLALPMIDSLLGILRREFDHPVSSPSGQIKSRRAAIFVVYGVTVFFLIVGFALFFWQRQYLPLLVGLSTLPIMLTVGKFSFRREWVSAGKVLENSLEARAEIQYAIGLSDWLALEGSRPQTMEMLAENILVVGRKLGFAIVRIHWDDGEEFWQLTGTNSANCIYFRRELFSGKNCFLVEFGLARPSSKVISQKNGSLKNESLTNFLVDLVAEGWSKAMASWEKQYQQPACFDTCHEPLVTPLVTAKTTTVSATVSESVRPDETTPPER